MSNNLYATVAPARPITEQSERERFRAIQNITPLLVSATRKHAWTLSNEQIELLTEAKNQLDMARQRFRSALMDADVLAMDVMFKGRPHGKD